MVSLYVNVLYSPNLSEKTEKETWTDYFVYASRGIGDNHCYFNEYKPTPNDVSINFYSCSFTFNSPIIWKARIKS